MGDPAESPHHPSPTTRHPRGIVTFLFTDIEGSTRLWERDAAVMRRAVDRHLEILTGAIRAHRGHHFKTVGDAVQAAFQAPADALAAAVAAQQALHAEPWTETGPIRVRMALHLGPAEPSPDGDYLAPALNRLARLLSAGYGGQVLITSALRDAAGGRLPAGVSLRSVGKHRLRDLVEPEEVWQMEIAGLPANFPPLKSLETHPTNLPPQTTPLIGRDAEIVALADVLDDEGPHVVTLTGPGGVGKTRLALAAAEAALQSFQDGAFLVALSAVEDADLLLPEIAAVLGVREGGGLTLEESVLAYLGGKRLLLVLDNLEQMQPYEAAAALVARLLTMRVMATSRAPLRIRAEREWPVAPLPVPDPDLALEDATASELAALAAVPAVALFIDRARAARPAWQLTERNAADVAEIARRLDGLPLAIELAAARIRVFSPAQLVRRLSDALDLLAGEEGALPDRQQTLRATIAWSHELLSFEDQAAFRRLAVFAGGFTLDAAEQVLAQAPDPWIDVLNAVDILVEQSLIYLEETAGAEPRYEMLETIRAFGLEQLAAAREDETLRRLHAEWAEAFARDADRHVTGPDAGEWLERYEQEHDNFRAAATWAIAHDPCYLGLRLPEALWRFWEIRGYYTEARNWLERSLAACPDAPPKLRGLSLDGLGNIAWRQGDFPTAERAYAESLAIWRETNERRSLSGTLSNLGNITELQGRFAEARDLQEEALAVARELDDPPRVATILNNLALVSWNLGDTARAKELLEESAAIKRKEGNLFGLATTLNNLGTLAEAMGDVDRARAYLEETLSLDRQLGNLAGIADSLGNLAGIIAAQGEFARAAALEAEALDIRRELGDQMSTAYSFEGIASTAARAGLAARAARLFGAADRLRADIGAPLPPSEHQRYETVVAMARDALSEEQFTTEWETGRGLPPDYAAAEALHLARQIADGLSGDSTA